MLTKAGFGAASASEKPSIFIRGVRPARWKSDEEIERYVPTHCCYCGVQCGMYLKVAGGKVVGVEPREDFPLNHGMLCPKGATAYQTVNHPDRLTYPLMRRGGKESPLERASWEEVLEIATRFRSIQASMARMPWQSLAAPR